MSKHARLAPSAAERWSNCPASVALCEGLEELPNNAAAKGTTLHAVAADMLMAGKVQVTKGCIDTLQLDARDVAAVNLYLKTVWATAHGDTVDMRVEQWFSLADLVHPDCGGTTDAAVYRHDDKSLHIFDAKFGIVPVDVEVEEESDDEEQEQVTRANKQLALYALGAYSAMSDEGLDIERVELCIVQPNAFAGEQIKRIEFDLMELAGLAMDLSDAAKATDDPNAPLVMGDHCKYCPANKSGRCPALNALAAQCASGEPPQPYGAAGIAESLAMADKLQHWIKSVRANAQYAASKGVVPPGYIYAETFGHRAWAVDDDFALRELCLLAPELNYTELMSVSKVEKLLGKKAFAKLAPALVTKPSRGFKLKQATKDNKQSAVDPLSLEFEKLD